MGRVIIKIALMFVLLLPAWAWAEEITELGASQIGDNTVKAIEHDIGRFHKTVTLFNTPENNILPSGPASEPVQRIKHRLANHSYWAVHYVPKDHREDHELAVFIDSHTGAILGIYTGN